MNPAITPAPADKDEGSGFIPLDYAAIDPAECLERSRWIYDQMTRRRSVRHFSDRPVERQVLENLILTAGSAPSGAHCQPWTFVAVSDPATKAHIRQAAEAEEKENYARRMPPEWLQTLEPLGTGWQKPYLEIAPWLVVVFQQNYRQLPGGERKNNYYVTESVGIAVGMFIAAVHQAGLVCLPHTPSPMGFLTQILERPPNEKPFVLIPVGYPADDCRVPDLSRKSLAEIALFREG